MEEDQKVKEIREKINQSLKEFYKIKLEKEKQFIPTKHRIQYAGPIYGYPEGSAFINSFLDGWFGVGRACDLFEKELSKFVGMNHGLLTNSGSSANLIATGVLTSHQNKNRLKKGDEVITSATAFPTTVNPIVLYGLTPVFVDAEIGTYISNTDSIREAITPKTRAIFIAHMLGNPYEMDALMDLAEDKNLVVIEDCCDALGSEYDGKRVGSFGDMSTYSLYVSHHMTTGEGGALLFKDPILEHVGRSIRDWGRSCVIPDCNVCKTMMDQEEVNLKFNLGSREEGRYIYSNLGYNLKPLEFQAAFGLEQIKRLLSFIEVRRKNFNILHKEMQNYTDYFILPRSHPKANPVWFGYPMTVKDNAPFDRKDLVRYLESKNIETRLLFSGNMIKHTSYQDVKYRVVGDLKNADQIMYKTLFIGIYPGIDKPRMDHILSTIQEFIHKHKHG